MCATFFMLFNQKDRPEFRSGLFVIYRSGLSPLLCRLFYLISQVSPERSSSSTE